jgi:hypothetical protein
VINSGDFNLVRLDPPARFLFRASDPLSADTYKVAKATGSRSRAVANVQGASMPPAASSHALMPQHLQTTHIKRGGQTSGTRRRVPFSHISSFRPAKGRRGLVLAHHLVRGLCEVPQGQGARRLRGSCSDPRGTQDEVASASWPRTPLHPAEFVVVIFTRTTDRTSQQAEPPTQIQQH